MPLRLFLVALEVLSRDLYQDRYAISVLFLLKIFLIVAFVLMIGGGALFIVNNKFEDNC